MQAVSPSFEVHLAVCFGEFEVLLEVGVFSVVDKDGPVHVVRVALGVLCELDREVEAGPEDEDDGGLGFHGAGTVYLWRQGFW